MREFPGAAALFEVIDQLCRRPRVGDRWPRSAWQRGTGGRGLPILCLVRDANRPDVLGAISDNLKSQYPSDLRRSYLDLSRPGDSASTDLEPPESVARIRGILQTAASGFVRNPDVRGPRLRFERFTLLLWLMDLGVDPNERHPDRAMRLLLQQRGLAVRLGHWIQRADEESRTDTWWWRASLWFLRLLTAVVFQVAVTGRVPVLSGHYRWFLRQPYLAPGLSGNFVRFASRLTRDEWQNEDQESVRLLLLHAFLEDLRQAYRLRFWQVWRRRETVYPVMLVDNADAGNGGFALLESINAVRNQTGLFDPLLVIAAATTAPPDAGTVDPARPRHDAAEAEIAHQRWRGALLRDQRRRRETAWFLPIRIPPAVEGPEKVWSPIDTVARRVRPAWWLSRWTRIGVPVVVIALAAGTVLWWQDAVWKKHCGSRDRDLIWTGSECVGISDGSFSFLPSDDAFRKVETVIADQNRQAESQHRSNPGRPFITIVVIEGFTAPAGEPSVAAGPRKSIEGVAVAQARQLNGPASTPLVKVLLANAGKQLGQGHRLVEPLRALLRRDPTVVGVVGLDQSRGTVLTLIHELTRMGVPMVSSTLSADTLAQSSPLYFQVAPSNRREARVAAAFADRRVREENRPRTVRIYYSSDADDIYSSNLNQDAREEFDALGFAVESVAFAPPGVNGRLNAGAAGRDICDGFRGVTFFAARGADFEEFISGAEGCGGKDSLLIGDDDVSNHVADDGMRTRTRAIPYYYLSFANTAIGAAQDYYEPWNELFSAQPSDSGPPSDPYGPLAYDATQVIITAATYLRDSQPPIPLSTGAVWREITAIHTPEQDDGQPSKALEGVTGTIDYGGDIARNVPLNKPITVVRVVNGEVVPDFRGYCGPSEPDPELRSEDWCPQPDQ
ncbi:ABC transporter substrate-binding protein [Nocardia harenae]|uniref:ABC transporter substrate-binding protein n=1 Tax=Nocardia harenae TaxID=358707 RepID=UPI000A434E18|nr:ABC transporter substrate-binding protein [Nocardia harenae]